MKFSGDYLYRVRVVRYPDGAFEPIGPIDPECPEDMEWRPVPGWKPPGWRPVGNYVKILGTDEFVWPVTSKVYGSRSTAKKRANLLESYGATAVIERSSLISWSEAGSRGSLPESKTGQVGNRGGAMKACAVVSCGDQRVPDRMRHLLGFGLVCVGSESNESEQYAYLGVGSGGQYGSALLKGFLLDSLIEALSDVRDLLGEEQARGSYQRRGESSENSGALPQ